MDVNPLVSVLISVYNEENWIQKSITSILNQTYDNIEVVVVNDGSTDGTLSILKELRTQDDRIKIIDQENKGLTKSLNNGITRCNGEYIARMDADNIAKEIRIEEQVKFLEKNSSYSLVGSFRKEIKHGKKRLRSFPVSDKDIKQWLIRACVISHSAVMIRRDTLKKYGYDESFKTSQDYDLWVRMAPKEKFYNIPKYLTTAYEREEGITNSKSRLEAFQTKMRIKRKALNKIERPFYRKIWLLKPFYELIR